MDELIFKMTKHAIDMRVIKVLLASPNAQFIYTHKHINLQIWHIKRLIWEYAVNSHMLLLFKLQQYISDMNYDAFYIPNCSLIKVHVSVHKLWRSSNPYALNESIQFT